MKFFTIFMIIIAVNPSNQVDSGEKCGVNESTEEEKLFKSKKNVKIEFFTLNFKIFTFCFHSKSELFPELNPCRDVFCSPPFKVSPTCHCICADIQAMKDCEALPLIQEWDPENCKCENSIFKVFGL